MERTGRDSGSIVLGWLTKLVVVLALGGVVAFDGIAVAVNNVTAQDDANAAAEAGAATYRGTHDLQASYAAAVAAVTNGNERVLPREFRIDPDGSVHLVLRRETRTLLMHHVGALRQYEHTDAHGDASPPPP
jgi:hypothetical protein